MRIARAACLRGLSDIRTRTGMVDSVGVPYLAYMRISCIEMEKARREKEKISAAARIRNIEARVAEIEAEKASILAALGERRRDGSSKREPKKEATKVSGNLRDAFKIKY
jgi:hypothetical protein